MNNHEQIRQKIDTGDFMHINGSVLRTLNVISDSRCSLSSLEYAFGNINRYRLMDSIKYLDSSEYVELTNSENGKKTAFKADQFKNTDISLTAKGVQVLRGVLADNCIEI